MEEDGGRDGCQNEKIIAPGGRLRLGSLLLPLSVEQPKRHIWIVVNKLAGDGALILKG